MASAAATQHYDVLVLGSGQSGSPLAALFAKAGRRTALVERAAVGGTCVNRGCAPTKTLIASGRVAALARCGPGVYGIHYSAGSSSASGGEEVRVRAEMPQIRQRKRDVVARWLAGGEKRLRDAGVDVLFGEARFTGRDGREVAVRLNDGGEEEVVGADIVLVNTGERPARPALSGLEEIPADRVLDSTSIMELGAVPARLIVLGGGYIGLEFGQLFRRLGAEVVLVQRAGQLVPREDADVAEAMLEILEEDGIRIHLSTRAKSIASTHNPELPIELVVESGSGTESITGSHILLATGRRPNTDMLNLEAVGLKTTERGHIVVNQRLETNVPGIYAIGDVHSGPAFTHISYDDFRIIRQNLEPDTVPATTPMMDTTSASKSRILTPYVVYTDPQLGHIGLHERDFPALGRKVKTAKMPMSYVARAIETEETRGLMKATVDAETGEILGFTCLGVEGGEVMAIVQTAMMGGLKWWDLEAAVWAHPSLAESLNNLWAYLERP